MLQICPVSVRSRSVEITPNWLEIAVPSPFLNKMIGIAVHFGFKCEICWTLWPPKKTLNCRAFKHVKLFNKRLKLQRQMAPQAYKYTLFIASGKGAESYGNFAEIRGKLSALTPSRTTPQVNC